MRFKRLLLGTETGCRWLTDLTFMCMCNNPKNINAPLVPETWTCVLEAFKPSEWRWIFASPVAGPEAGVWPATQPVKTRTGNEVVSFQSDLSKIFQIVELLGRFGAHSAKAIKKEQEKIGRNSPFHPKWLHKVLSSHVMDNFTAVKLINKHWHHFRKQLP